MHKALGLLGYLLKQHHPAEVIHVSLSLSLFVRFSMLLPVSFSLPVTKEEDEVRGDRASDGETEGRGLKHVPAKHVTSMSPRHKSHFGLQGA
jgi:hypothetical protein